MCQRKSRSHACLRDTGWIKLTSVPSLGLLAAAVFSSGEPMACEAGGSQFSLLWEDFLDVGKCFGIQG